MTSADPKVILPPDPSLTAAIDLLGEDSYTAQRLRHADADHLHLTSRRCFIGPIPEGWLRSHREEWYKRHLGIHHSSKAPSFSAPSNVGTQRRMTGIDGPIKPSFPQPADAVDGATGSTAIGAYDQEPAATNDGEIVEDAPAGDSPAVPVSRAIADGEVLGEHNLPRTDGPTSGSHKETTARLSQDPRKDREKSKQKPGRAKSKKPQNKRQKSATSYKTARETMSIQEPASLKVDQPTQDRQSPSFRPSGPPGITIEATGPTSPRDSAAMHGSLNLATPSSPSLSGLAGSTRSLLRTDQGALNRTDTNVRTEALTEVVSDGVPTRAEAAVSQRAADNTRPLATARSQVQFDLVNAQSRRAEVQLRARLAQRGLKSQGRILTKGRLKSGEIVKMEKMLLRVDIATGVEQPEADFVEKDSQRVETRVIDKWREFMVVCRECEVDAELEDDSRTEFNLQMYQTRVIPATDRSKVKKRFKHEIKMDRAHVRITLYSSLDKTIAICTPEGPRTKIYFLRARSGTSSVEWFHFLRSILGLRRAKTIQVNIPDLSASVRLDNPFDRMPDPEELEKVAAGDEEALIKTVQSDSFVAKNIIDRCLTILANGDEFSDVLEAWSNHDHIGLAWKRYDRLEWVHGEHEKNMYGANAMIRTHELELRVKEHYPQAAENNRRKTVPEPPPVEGFLIRLTTQKGAHKKMGKFFFKRLYFTTYNQFLIFMRPGRAQPPPPPTLRMASSSAIPAATKLASEIPLIYAVNPFTSTTNRVDWLTDPTSTSQTADKHDLEARAEAERTSSLLERGEGFINLSSVVKVRAFDPTRVVDEAAYDSGSDVDFDAPATDAKAPDGATSELDADRTLELVLRNGLVIRLQSYNLATRQEWILRLSRLAKYWTCRVQSDTALYRSVRQENLRTFNIDERAEAEFGQFAAKWEVTKSFASAELYNLCGIAGCRSIHLAGQLYRKKRVHATFEKVHAILCKGRLLLFRDTERTLSGRRIQHIYHERVGAIDLAQCYLYSGLMTENDLLAQNRTFDSNMPGNTALPRLWPDDRWSSTDEDAMTTFVLWSAKGRGWFWNRDGRDRDETGGGGSGGGGGVLGGLKRVTKLGQKGRSMVWKCRSRAERDRWVLAIQAEIERVAKDDGVRVVGMDKA